MSRDKPPPRPRREGIPLGRIAGIPIILAYSWFLIAAFILIVFGPRVAAQFPQIGAGSYAVALAYALLLMVSVLIHELSHALSAKAFKWPTARIVLNLWGGHTQFEHFNATPGRSLVVALAGPAANFVLALLGWFALPLFDPFSVGRLLCNIFVWANLLIAIFNVLPGMPLDGGRIVESAVWRITGSQDKGTLAAGWAGRIIVILLVLVVIGLPLLAGGVPDLSLIVVTFLVCGFMWVGASAAINNARIRLRLPAVSAGKLKEPAISVPAGSTVAQVRAALAVSPGAAVVLTAANGQPDAVVDDGALANVPDGLGASTPVNAVARALSPGAYVPEAAAGEELVQYLARLAGNEYAVIDSQGRVTGLLRQAAVLSVITGRAR